MHKQIGRLQQLRHIGAAAQELHFIFQVQPGGQGLHLLCIAAVIGAYQRKGNGCVCRTGSQRLQQQVNAFVPKYAPHINQPQGCVCMRRMGDKAVQVRAVIDHLHFVFRQVVATQIAFRHRVRDGYDLCRMPGGAAQQPGIDPFFDPFVCAVIGVGVKI